MTPEELQKAIDAARMIVHDRPADMACSRPVCNIARALLAQSARIAELEGVLAMFTLPEPNPEEDDSQCVLCHSTMHIRDGDEPTLTCDHCAQDLVSKARAAAEAKGKV